MVCLHVDDQNRWKVLRKLPFHPGEAVSVLEVDAVVAVVMMDVVVVDVVVAVVMAGVGVVVWYLVVVVVNKILRDVDTSVEGLGSQAEIFHLYVQASWCLAAF